MSTDAQNLNDQQNERTEETPRKSIPTFVVESGKTLSEEILASADATVAAESDSAQEIPEPKVQEKWRAGRGKDHRTRRREKAAS